KPLKPSVYGVFTVYNLIFPESTNHPILYRKNYLPNRQVWHHDSVQLPQVDCPQISAYLFH
ncbi:hypothetical protein, partial [Schaedlerella arabinosiphila]|uniref:hypothetical protein n=1 Tax=Schaedlerella arabinosiphila TaxID=2044587 RepID=UPI002557D6BD